MVLKPGRLVPGCTVGIVAPASPWYDEEDIKKGIENLKKLGFNVVTGDAVWKKRGYLAGDDRERADDINSFFKNEGIDGIICLRGGYGTARLLDMVDYHAIRKNPKVFIGYSDITALHIAINKFCNLVTFHGPVLTNFINGMDDFTRDSFIKVVGDKKPIGKVINPDNCDGIEVLVRGEGSGKIIGGNLSIITSLLGTPYEIDIRGRILFIEDVGEEPYRIDRMLTQLLLSGKLKQCHGIVLGQWTSCTPEDPEKSLSVMEILHDRLGSLGIPVIYNVAAGHGSTKITIPMGVEASITRDGWLSIDEGAVI